LYVAFCLLVFWKQKKANPEGLAFLVFLIGRDGRIWTCSERFFLPLHKLI